MRETYRICIDCGIQFEIPLEDQAYFNRLNIELPYEYQYCETCRNKWLYNRK